jgi:hypothetical protein
MKGTWALLVAVLASVLALAGKEPERQVKEPERHRAHSLEVGFGECDVTPTLEGKVVYLAGFGKNRKATGVHDPIMVRALVLGHGKTKLALASVDVVGLFRESVERVRKRLPGFAHVLVSSTHNHEGPDTLGLWGPNPFQSGIDPAYMKKVEEGIVEAIGAADRARKPARARLGTACAPELLFDGREPYVKHDELTAIQFLQPDSDRTLGLVVQWNCHPETLDSRNTRISADFVASTVGYLRRKHGCPVVYFTGTVGGLMTSLHVEVKNDKGEKLSDGTFAKTERYGELVGRLADRALAKAAAVSLTPLKVRTRAVFLPLDNPLYLLGWKLEVLVRQAYRWSGDPYKAEALGPKETPKGRLCLQSELTWLRLGDLDVAAIPGEIYPELVLGKVQDPVDPGADFPDAPIEPAIYSQLAGPHRMLIGLAGDEIGYILPKRQWDEKPPFCYGRKKSQYGEVNSLGPDTSPILCEAFQELTRAGREKKGKGKRGDRGGKLTE